MQLYAIALITWTTIVTTSTESNVANFSNGKDTSYTEFHDSSVEQIVQPYVAHSTNEKSSEQIQTKNRSDNATNDGPVGLSRSVTRAESASGSNGVSTIDPASLGESAYATPLTEMTGGYPFQESPGSESRYAIPEDVLLVESAGTFGQRVRQIPPSGRTIAGRTLVKTSDNPPSDEYVSFRKSISSTVSPLKEEDNQKKIHVSTTWKPSVPTLKKKSILPDNSPFDNLGKTIRLDLSVKDLDENSRPRSSLSGTNGASILENDVVPEHLSKSQARLSRTRNATEDTSKKIMVVSKNSESVATSTSVEISPSLQLSKFSGPIIVPDLPVQKAQDSTIDYIGKNSLSEAFRPLEDADSVLETNIRSSKTAVSNDITASSLMLNPLQVGITLVNAVETGSLMDDSELSAATETKDYFRDDLQQRSVSDELVENKGNHSDVTYKDENIQSDEGERAIEVVTQRAPDNSVEIQKSIELYHTAPVHEIHYPVEYIQQTTNLGVIETNSIGNAQKLRQPYDQESRLNYDVYQGNDATEKSIIKGQAASVFSQQFNRQEYNVLEDDVGKPTASALIAEYTSNTQEHIPVDNLESQPQQYNEARPALLVANQFDDALYEQSNAYHTLNNKNNDTPLHTALIESPTRHEAMGEFVKPYVTTSVPYREQQTSSMSQPIDQHPFRLQPEVRRPQELPTQLLLKIIPNGSPNAGFLVPIPRPYPIEKIVEKTIHVPHPIEVEKVIEKKVQVPVLVPQPYPVHVPVDRLVEKQIRVPHLYPIQFERVIEKRVPYTVQRLVVQPASPYPLHLKSPAAYPAQVGPPIDRPAHIAIPIERPTHVTASSSFVEHSTQVAPAPIEKTAEKLVTGSSRPIRPYHTDPDQDGSIETRYKYQQRPREPIFANENVDPGYSGSVAFESQLNASQFYGDPYVRSPFANDHRPLDDGKHHIPATAHLSGNVRLMIVPKKFGAHHTVLLRPHVSTPSYPMLPVTFRRQIMYNLVEKDKPTKDEYAGPLPPRKVFVSQTKPLLPAAKPSLYSTSVTQSPATITGGLRRTRQPETQYPGSFRQSKMEYGFKPPMVPSVQYDEKTGSKVEN
ncbi:uncharacterized protein LOC116853332 [Odontomachus brunneus]|uniref:uncharacterized protein LOC116853332 n=1 Tax=Odontomachus brunneus TaxID=486640 RepID=UPI0013F2238A|nr:uncharacterized protein LOC116853332 [Odontomachus brunneus]